MTERAPFIALALLGLIACEQNTSVGSQNDAGALDSQCREACAADAATPPRDAGVVAPDATSPDATASDAAVAELFLLAVDVQGPHARVTQRIGGSWQPMTDLGEVIGPDRGGGVAALPDGRAVVLVPKGVGARGMLHAAVFDGSWSALSSLATSVGNVTGDPHVTSAGIWAAHQTDASGLPVVFDAFDAASSTWSVAEPTTLLAGSGVPVVARVGGEPMIVDGNRWVIRTGSGWSAPAPTPSRVPDECMARPKLIERAGSGDVLGVFFSGGNGLAGCPGAGFGVHSAVFRAGAWTDSATIALPAIGVLNGPLDGVAVAALPDGRVALAYAHETPSGGPPLVAIGFHDGASWSAFRDVPGVVAAHAFRSIAIAPGSAGAALELVYVEEPVNGGAEPVWPIEHVRLTGEAGWTWSAPVTVEATRRNVFVALAAPTR